jgi:hypothetical protein
MCIILLTCAGAEALKKYLRTRLSDPEAAEAAFAAALASSAAGTNNMLICFLFVFFFILFSTCFG